MTWPLLPQIIAFTILRVVLNTMQRMVYPFLAIFARGLGVSPDQFSTALALRAASGALAPFFASIADSRGRKSGMLFGMLIFMLGIVAILIWPVFPVFVTTLVLTSVGYLTFIPSMQAYLGDRVPYRERGRALGITEFGWSLSFILGTFGVSFLLERWGWKSPFPFLLGFSLFFFLLFWRWIEPDPPRSNHTAGAIRSLRQVFTYPQALFALGMSFSLAAANEIINLIFGVWLEASYGLQITQLGLAAVAIGMTELMGEGLSTGLVDRLGKAKAVGIGIGLNVLAAFLLVGMSSSLAGAVAALLFFYLSFEFTLVSSLPLLTEVLPGARASFMAANIALISVGRSLGALLSPWLFRQSHSLGLPALSLNAFGAFLLNLLALAALLTLWKGMKDVEP